MQQQFNNAQQQTNPGMRSSEMISSNLNHAAHEVLDVHEVLSGTLGTLDHYLMYQQQIKDPKLMDILNRQRQFITDQYNILVESFSSGKEPSRQTSTYMMKQSNDVVYGLKPPSQPTKPNQQVSDIGDKCISGLMLSCMKTAATTMTMAAGESTNPVVRRVLQDSIPNYLEMAYEIFLYQNKQGFYQVPQLNEQDMQQLINSYAPASGMQSTGQPGNMMQ